MISLDWKERLKQDTTDFFQRKLPAKNYDIDIIYNAFPERIDNKIPHAVITLVAKTLASKIARTADKYFDFYDSLLQNKGENGIIIFAYIMSRAIKKKPDVFLNYLQNILYKIKDQKACNLIVDKAIYPFLKNRSLQYLDMISRWIKKDNKILNLSIQKLLVKLIINDPQLIDPIFKKLETSWLYATQNRIKLNVNFLKAIYKLDADYYMSIFDDYKSTRNPVFADILCGSICCYNKNIQDIVDHWAKSGNIKLKKIGLHGQKVLKKIK